MNKITTHIGLLLLRLGFSVGLMTHGYGKLLRVWEGNFKFGDPIGIGSAPSLILASFWRIYRSHFYYHRMENKTV